MSANPTFQINLKRLQDFEFQVDFDWQNVAPVIMDEPEPLGHQKGPNAARMLGAAVGNCLSASLVFCLQKAKVPVKDVQTTVLGTLVRNEKGRLRVGKFDVTIRLDADSEHEGRISRCLSLFEDYCVVTGSVRQGIEVNVSVTDADGRPLVSEKNPGH